MPQASLDPLEYYAHPGLMTDPRDQADMFRDLPSAIPALCQAVQGVLLHIHWAERYGEKLLEERKQEVNIRPVGQRLARIRQVNRLPLVIPRPNEERQVGNCHDFSTLLCAMLRYQGVPARARCGFAKYFILGHFERLRECEAKMDDLCRPFEAHIARLDTVTRVDWRAAQDALRKLGCKVYGLLDRHYVIEFAMLNKEIGHIRRDIRHRAGRFHKLRNPGNLVAQEF